MTFNDFIKKHNLKNKATSNIKIQHIYITFNNETISFTCQLIKI